MRLRLALARLALAATLVGHALAQDPNNGNGGADNGGNNDAGNQQSVSPSPSATPTPSNNNNNNANTDNGGNGGNSNAPAPASAVNTNRTLSIAPSVTAAMAAGDVVATTVTSLIPGPSNVTQTAVFTFTFTVGGHNATADNNSTLTNGTADSNATVTNETIPWNDTMSYLPFTPNLDAAYGLGGALLILSGIPVATLGGKSRWSALAIVSGYTVAFFCLIIILSFGVSPALEPPSPNPPTAAMRGLYLLAIGISCIVGAGLGVFFFTFAKYWVGAVGGFCFGWWLLALRKGGLVQSIGPRWAILGPSTVIVLAATFIPQIHEYVLLVASALVGATAFTLGVDCFTRAGLKEFYIYNLGYANLFESLKGGKFPLTQSMQVEIGVVAAATLIAALIQFKVVSLLQKRRKQIVEDEEARREADEVARAAENFKNVDAELAEWEGKHGDSIRKGSGSMLQTPLQEPRSFLPGDDYNQSSSTLLGTPSNRTKEPHPDLQINPRRMSLLEEMGYRDEINPTSPNTPTLLVHDADPELEQHLNLLADVRRAREGIQMSMDKLRSTTTTPLDNGRTASVSSHDSHSRPATVVSMMDRGRGVIPNQTVSAGHSRANSTSSSRLLDIGPRERQNSTASSRMLDDRPRSRHLSGASSRLLGDDDFGRRDSITGRSLGGSLDERRRGTFLPGEYSAAELGTRLSLAETGNRPAEILRVHSSDAAPQRTRSTSTPDYWEKRNAEWDDYVKSRNIQNPALSPPLQNEDMAVVSGGVARAISQRNEGGTRVAERTPGQEYGATLVRALSMDMERQAAAAAAASPRRPSLDRAPRSAPRAMTTEELAERHREKLSKMQDRVSAPIKEQLAIAAARDEWSKAQAREREEQARRERERGARAPKPRHERGDTAKERIGEALTSRQPPRSSDRRKRTEEWRQSVPVSPQKGGATVTPSTSQNRISTLLPKSPPTGTAPLPRERASRRPSNVNIA